MPGILNTARWLIPLGAAAAIYAEAQRITGAAASRSGPARNLTARFDAWLTSSWLGVPVMLMEVGRSRYSEVSLVRSSGKYSLSLPS